MRTAILKSTREFVIVFDQLTEFETRFTLGKPKKGKKKNEDFINKNRKNRYVECLIAGKRRQTVSLDKLEFPKDEKSNGISHQSISHSGESGNRGKRPSNGGKRNRSKAAQVLSD